MNAAWYEIDPWGLFFSSGADGEGGWLLAGALVLPAAVHKKMKWQIQH
jgi:hypothetical protein